MDAKRIELLAASARSLATRVTQTPAEQMGPWMNELGGLLRIYFSNNQPAPEIVSVLSPEQIGVLESRSQYLLARRSGISSAQRETTSRHLQEVAGILMNAATALSARSPTPLEATMPVAVELSSELVGPWRLLHDTLGRGGQGEVTLAWHDAWRISGALKRMTGRRSLTEKARTRFLREMEAFKRIRHPFVVRVLDASDHPEPYLVTEVAPFGSLHDNKAVYCGDLWRTLRMARDAALGLAEVHLNSIVHRDVKPKNILLHSLDHALIADFGIAHFEDLETITSLDSHPRAFWFAPPESESNDDPTPAFDVFSLGATIHSLLTRSAPSRPYRVLGALPKLSNEFAAAKFAAVDSLLARMTARELPDRIQSMSEVVQQLDDVLEQLFGNRRTGDSCTACDSGQFEKVGIVRLGSGTEINIYHNDASKGAIGFVQLWPELMMCRSCGNLRIKAGEKAPRFSR